MAFLRRLVGARTFDLLAALPLTVFYAFAVAGLIIVDVPKIEQLSRVPQWLGALDVASQLVGAAFLALQVVLFLIRRIPAAKAPGILPRVAALIGANLGVVFLALPRVHMQAKLAASSMLLILIGTAGAIHALAWLRRSFAIFPQARELVSGGPYRMLRHPLYLAELVAGLGLMLQFRQPWAALLYAAIVAAQFPRMYYEEKVLSEAFPAYRDYMKKTARLIPGVY